MRREDWVDQLFRVIDEHQGAEFAYGSTDCVLFAARVADAMTDGDYEAQMRAIYQDERSAVRALAERGGLEGAVRSVLGEPIGLAYLQRGDIVLFENAGREMLGVWDGQAIVAPTAAGLGRAQVDAARVAWRVP